MTALTFGSAPFSFALPAFLDFGAPPPNLGTGGRIMSEPVIKGPASYFPSIEKTYGRPISEWQAMIRAQGDRKHMELVQWLKDQHQMGHGHANALVAHTLAEDRKG
nr:DUF4287 domain-containing protein [Ketogulonicigenium vulgare]